MKRSLSGCKGFISTYFLMTLLFVISFVTVIMNCGRLETASMVNLKTAEAYFRKETEVINTLRCLLEDADGETSFQTDSFSATISGTQIVVSVYGEYAETLIVTYDPPSGMIMDYDAVREVEVLSESGV